AGELLGEKGFQASSGGYTDAASYASSLANGADELGRTPLMWAAYANFNSEERLAETDKKRAEFAELLIRNGADAAAMDKDGWTALMWASWSGLPLVAERAAEAGAPISSADAQGNTALMLAAMRGNADIVRFLAAKKADKDAVNKAGKRAADLAADNLARYPKKTADYREIIDLLGV
ncbi:MAG TPA: ankyrin repeat domain-containing protein, partial [Elusimicrobiales bacterium]|nr:ankyrin repeat domain-containing protein [Elusimicrobiales bacterium]